MEKVCKSCEHFVQVSSGFSKYIWGDCMKDVDPVESDGKEKRGSFMWANKTCSDFKPRQKPGKDPDKL